MWLVVLHAYLVVSYLAAWAIIHWTPFDSNGDLSHWDNRLLAIIGGPLVPPFFILVVAIGVPCALMTLLCTHVPPFTLFGNAYKAILRAQINQVREGTRACFKKRQLCYLQELSPEDQEMRKEWLRDNGYAYVLDEADPEWQIRVEAPGCDGWYFHLMEQAAQMLGGKDFRPDTANKVFDFTGTHTIIERLRAFAERNPDLKWTRQIRVYRLDS